MIKPPFASYYPYTCLLLILIIAACSRPADTPEHDLTPVDIRSLITDEIRELSLEALREKGEIIVLTRNAPTTFYEDRDGLLAGPEHDLVASFSEFLGVKPRFQIVDTVGEALDVMRADGAHMAAAGLTRTELREEEFLFGPNYRTVQQQVVCHRDGQVPKKPKDLVGLDIVVTGDSSYTDSLYRLSQQFSGLDWESSDEMTTEELMEQVWLGELDCTVADSNIVAINRRYFPELTVAFPISEEEPLAWIVAERAKVLLPMLEEWFEQAEKKGELADIQHRYYAHVEIFDYIDVSTYLQRIDKRLPRFRAWFEIFASRHDLPWTLLAAMGYQESHWDPKARSPTGVRGLMMLTRHTAKEVDVENRLDPRESIKGGALYLKRLMERLPETIVGLDRVWIAMAAYNVGLGHVWDARKLARRQGKNPDLWRDLRTVLPLLAKRKYYRTLKHGYARGNEPVRYVRNIRNYRDILERQLATP